MAGSYWHCVEEGTGKLLTPQELANTLDNMGDVYEAIEHMYEMIWYFADGEPGLVKNAAKGGQSLDGRSLSPGLKRLET